MRLARINGINIDIDEQTAIGLTLQSYDIKQPGKRFVTVSNSFTIPSTNHNLSIFGHAGNTFSKSLKVYEQATFDYWVDNEHLINNAGVRAESFSDRISLFTFQKPSVWDQLKLVKWPDFVADFVRWADIPKRSNQSVGTFADFIEPYTTATTGIKLPLFVGSLYNYQPEGSFIENVDSIWLRYWRGASDKSDGGHFCLYVKTIFEYIESKYGINFLTAGGLANGNIWDDTIAVSMYVPIRELTVRHDTGFYFEADPSPIYQPHKDQKDKADKTLYDCVNAFMQHFNVICDDLTINNQPAIRLARFDDLLTKADIVDWSNNMSGKATFKPAIEGYAQSNRIKFSKIFETGDTLLNSRVITCGNKNLDALTDMFDIDAFICPFVQADGGVIPDLSSKESFQTFVFMVDGGLTNLPVNISLDDKPNYYNAAFRMQRAALYSLNSEYQLVDQILDAPRFYDAQRWITLSDVKNFEFFRLYYIRELGGSFFVNKISGFNPQKSNAPTKIELIKVSDETANYLPIESYWVDGINDPFSDGIGDLYF